MASRPFPLQPRSSHQPPRRSPPPQPHRRVKPPPVAVAWPSHGAPLRSSAWRPLPYGGIRLIRPKSVAKVEPRAWCHGGQFPQLRATSFVNQGPEPLLAGHITRSRRGHPHCCPPSPDPMGRGEPRPCELLLLVLSLHRIHGLPISRYHARVERPEDHHDRARSKLLSGEGSTGAREKPIVVFRSR